MTCLKFANSSMLIRKSENPISLLQQKESCSDPECFTLILNVIKIKILDFDFVFDFGSIAEL